MNYDLGNFLLRLSFGLTMAFAHGWPKYANYSVLVEKFPDVLGFGVPLSLGLAIFAELVCALLVAVGLFTRMAAIPMIITMGVAAFVIHGNDPFKKQEMALLYLAAYIVIFIMGSGKYSLQGMAKLGSNSKIPFLNFLLK